MTIDFDKVCEYLAARDTETARRLAFERIMAMKRIDAERRGIPLNELLTDEEEKRQAVFRRFVEDLR